MAPGQIAAIVADREAGTPGAWSYEEKPGKMSAHETQSSIGVWAQARWDAAYEDNPDDIDNADDAAWLCGIWGKIDNEDKANARRIARVPEMEEAIIEQTEEIAALKMCNDESEREVVALRALNARLRTALRVFADPANWFDVRDGGQDPYDGTMVAAWRGETISPEEYAGSALGETP